MLSTGPDRSPRWRNKPPRRREWPNFFVGFRVTSTDLVAQVEQIQTAIRDACPDVEPCLIDPRTLHVTLCVLRLSDDAAVDQACQVLHSMASRVAAEDFVRSSTPQFNFSDWGFFGKNDVLYAKLDVTTDDGLRLAAVAERLHGEFEELGLTTERFRRPYSPHMTVWKTSRDRELIRSLNAQREPDEPSVQDDVYQVVEAFKCAAETTTSLGVEHPISIELLSMKEKESDGKNSWSLSSFIIVVVPLTFGCTKVTTSMSRLHSGTPVSVKS
ncbi:A-kinase anchor protein 7 isoform gamma [Phytophthora citrophthora]|uniref:A-kinase anchor protein 7 isoform gamma n=1 Tax=Phytophthora citrophthora TaxID=4793 RepID=A0AAD9LC14_9STRA|nr:A-kinase anchor protein 7 isoform gamma [Phytophthora citrophthora]